VYERHLARVAPQVAQLRLVLEQADAKQHGKAGETKGYFAIRARTIQLTTWGTSKAGNRRHLAVDKLDSTP